MNITLTVKLDDATLAIVEKFLNSYTAPVVAQEKAPAPKAEKVVKKAVEKPVEETPPVEEPTVTPSTTLDLAAVRAIVGPISRSTDENKEKLRTLLFSFDEAPSVSKLDPKHFAAFVEKAKAIQL